MADNITVILNTFGGKLGTQAKTTLVENGMRDAGIEYCLEVTNHPDHGIELAQQAALKGCSTFVAAGGDGTINEVVNGLMRAPKENQTRALVFFPWAQPMTWPIC